VLTETTRQGLAVQRQHPYGGGTAARSWRSSASSPPSPAASRSRSLRRIVDGNEKRFLPLAHKRIDLVNSEGELDGVSILV
jgi:hypothetical protein